MAKIWQLCIGVGGLGLSAFLLWKHLRGSRARGAGHDRDPTPLGEWRKLAECHTTNSWPPDSCHWTPPADWRPEYKFVVKG